jgi:hypothetical protein
MAEVSAANAAGGSDEMELPVSSSVAVYSPVGTGTVVPRTAIDASCTVYAYASNPGG